MCNCIGLKFLLIYDLVLIGVGFVLGFFFNRVWKDNMDTKITHCPECGQELQFKEGCMCCPVCGWGKCS
jgi:hypothetical protein